MIRNLWDGFVDWFDDKGCGYFSLALGIVSFVCFLFCLYCIGTLLNNVCADIHTIAESVGNQK